MVREFPSIPFERYCDDVVVHCGSERQARMVRDAIAARLAQVQWPCVKLRHAGGDALIADRLSG
jgi:hypothetical protein